MNKDRLQSILHLAEAKENNAAKNFVEARKSHEFNQDRLNELRSFRDEYHQNDSRGSFSAAQFQSTRVFLSQLSEVIDQQELQVASSYGDMKDEKEVWLSHRVKRRSIELLGEKQAIAMDLQMRRKEQKELDEVSRHPSFSHGLSK